MNLTKVGRNNMPAQCVVLFSPEQKEFSLYIRGDLKYLPEHPFVKTAKHKRFVGYTALLPQIAVGDDLQWGEAESLARSFGKLCSEMLDQPMWPISLDPGFNQPMTMAMAIDPGEMCMIGEFSSDFVRWIQKVALNNERFQKRLMVNLAAAYNHMMGGRDECEVKVTFRHDGYFGVNAPGDGACFITFRGNNAEEGCGVGDHNTDNVHQLLLYWVALGLMQEEYLRELGCEL